MKCRASACWRHRFPPEVIQHAAWLYHRFNLSHREIEDLLARRAVDQDGEVIDVLLQERRDAASERLCVLGRRGGDLTGIRMGRSCDRGHLTWQYPVRA